MMLSTLCPSKKNTNVFIVHSAILILFPWKIVVTGNLAWLLTVGTGTQNYDSKCVNKYRIFRPIRRSLIFRSKF
jgi:hypothetical protein